MGKENVAHTYNGILFSHKIEWYLAVYDNMDGPIGIKLSET